VRSSPGRRAAQRQIKAFGARIRTMGLKVAGLSVAGEVGFAVRRSS
jgi:hypothetical protein